MLLSSAIGWLQQLWPETELLDFLDTAGIQDPFNLRFTQDICASFILTSFLSKVLLLKM